MIITIDCDEVLAESLDAILAHHHYKLLGDPIQKADITNYHMHQIREMHLTRKDEVNYIEGFMIKPESVIKIQPVSGAKEKLTQWKSEGHELHVVTGRGDNLIENTTKWINMHFPGIFTDIHFANTHQANQRKKSEILKELGSEMMVEDFLYYAEDVAGAGIKTFLLDKPRNQEYDAERMPNIYKVKKWGEIRI